MSIAGRDPAELADEYAIGLLDEADRAELERRMAADPALAALVAAARERFLALDLGVEPVTPGAGLWARIEGALDAGAGAGPAPDAAATPPAQAVRQRGRLSARRGPRRPGPRPGIGARAPQGAETEGEARQPVRGSLVTLGALAASLLLAVALAVSLTWQPAPQVVAVLLDDAGQPFALVEGAEDNTTRITVLGEAEVPDGRVLQVWTKPGPDRPPVSLGTVARAVGATLGARGLPPPTAGQLYEITLEVQGGSPTGLPTGPILGKGLARVPK